MMAPADKARPIESGAVPSAPHGSIRPDFHRQRTLEAWLARRTGAKVVFVESLEHPANSGLSNEILLFQARLGAGKASELREFALRLQPLPEHQLFMEPDLQRQHELLRRLHRVPGVKVPDSYWYEDDPQVLGRPFLVMQRLRGRAPVTLSADGNDWLSKASTPDRAQLWYAAVEQLAHIHHVPAAVTALLERPGDGKTGIEQDLAHWRRAAKWSAPEGIPQVLIEIEEWLHHNCPLQPESTLSWGDSRIGNMMFDDDFQVVGVLDWEMASLAGPIADLAWWLYIQDHQLRIGHKRLEGIGDRQATIDLWETLSGLAVRDLHWYEVFAGYRLCILGLRHMHTSNWGDATTGSKMRNSFFAHTCELLEIEVPAEFLKATP